MATFEQFVERYGDDYDNDAELAARLPAPRRESVGAGSDLRRRSIAGRCAMTSRDPVENSAPGRARRKLLSCCGVLLCGAGDAGVDERQIGGFAFDADHVESLE